MNEKEKASDLKSLLQENFDAFQDKLRNILVELTDGYFIEKEKEWLRQLTFQIWLKELDGYEKPFVVGDNSDSTAFKCAAMKPIEQLNKTISFENKNINPRGGARGYNYELGVRHPLSECENKVLIDLVVETVRMIIMRAFKNLAVIVGENDLEIEEWQAFENNILEQDFMQCYKEEIKKQCKLPEWQEIEEVGWRDYEKIEIGGCVCLVNNIKKDGNRDIVIFEESIPQEEGWKPGFMRKMIEASRGQDSCLVVDADNFDILGIAFADTGKEMIDKELKIEFIGRGKWSLYKQGVELLHYENGRYVVNQQKAFDEIEEKVAQIGLIPEDKRMLFGKIFAELNQLQHGALMIILKDAKSRTHELCNTYKRGIAVNVDLSADDNRLQLLKMNASVDGAVIVDQNGMYYGFGVILDGEAMIKGEPSRGSRYNSSRNFIAGKDAYAVLVSEDKKNGIEVFKIADTEIIPPTYSGNPNFQEKIK